MNISDRTFRLLSGVLAILAVLCLLLPSHVVSVPESITADPADAAAMNRSTPLWKEMLGNEPNLRAEVAEKGVADEFDSNPDFMGHNRQEVADFRDHVLVELLKLHHKL